MWWIEEYTGNEEQQKKDVEIFFLQREFCRTKKPLYQMEKNKNKIMTKEQKIRNDSVTNKSHIYFTLLAISDHTLCRYGLNYKHNGNSFIICVRFSLVFALRTIQGGALS